MSPTYAREIQTPEYGFGLDGALRARAGVLSGILNGVDYREWSPDADPLIPAPYSVDDLSGKAHLQARTAGRVRPAARKPSDSALLGVSRALRRRRATDILVETAARIVAEGACLVALGTGDPEYEEVFRLRAAEHPGRIAVRIGFDNAPGAPH